MKAYLIKKDEKTEEFEQIVEFSSEKIVVSAGKGMMTVFASDGEYFSLTDDAKHKEAIE